jgi:hypothetical protein
MGRLITRKTRAVAQDWSGRRWTTRIMAESHLRPDMTQAVKENVEAQLVSLEEEESVGGRFDAPKEMDHDEHETNIEREDQTPAVVSEAESEELPGKTLTTAETIYIAFKAKSDLIQKRSWLLEVRTIENPAPVL